LVEVLVLYYSRTGRTETLANSIAEGAHTNTYRVSTFHNYIRTHEGLNGKTPAEACGITVKGKNKWKTLIQNASKNP